MGIVLEEADESLFWLELLVESGITSREKFNPLLKESNELVSIFVASLRTAKGDRNTGSTSIFPRDSPQSI
jgi:four helix bundle protein